MLGRAAYHNTALLADVDHRLFGAPATAPDWIFVRDAMMDYADRFVASGGRLGNVTRHMIGLFTGIDGARRFRQILSTDANRPGSGAEVIFHAFQAVGIGPMVADAAE